MQQQQHVEWIDAERNNNIVFSWTRIDICLYIYIYIHIAYETQRIIHVGQDADSFIDLRIPYLWYRRVIKQYLCYGIYNSHMAIEGLIAFAKLHHQSLATDRRNSKHLRVSIPFRTNTRLLQLLARQSEVYDAITVSWQIVIKRIGLWPFDYLINLQR